MIRKMFKETIYVLMRLRGPKNVEEETDPTMLRYASGKFLGIADGCKITKWRNTKDWNDTEQFPHHNTKVKQQWLSQL